MRIVVVSFLIMIVGFVGAKKNIFNDYIINSY